MSVLQWSAVWSLLGSLEGPDYVLCSQTHDGNTGLAKQEEDRERGSCQDGSGLLASVSYIDWMLTLVEERHADGGEHVEDDRGQLGTNQHVGPVASALELTTATCECCSSAISTACCPPPTSVSESRVC